METLARGDHPAAATGVFDESRLGIPRVLFFRDWRRGGCLGAGGLFARRQAESKRRDYQRQTKTDCAWSGLLCVHKFCVLMPVVANRNGRAGRLTMVRPHGCRSIASAVANWIW